MSEAKYTSLPVRTLGPARALTLEQHQQMQAYEPGSPSGGTREHGTPKPSPLRWWEQGPCARQGHDSVWLSPSKYPKAVVHAAASQCAKCPVKKQCSEQPLPHVGITAGRIHWEGTRYAESVKLCDQCMSPTSRNSRFCSQSCKDRWHYLDRLRDGERTFGPLYAWFGNKSMTTIAKACGVAERTVYRWDASGVVPAGAVKQLTKRLGVEVEDIWPDTSAEAVMTANRRAAMIWGAAENGEKTGSVGTAPVSSKEPSDDTGGPLVSIVRQPSAPVKPGGR